MLQLAGYLLGRNKKNRRQRQQEEACNNFVTGDFFQQEPEKEAFQQPVNKRRPERRPTTKYFYQEPGDNYRVEVMENNSRNMAPLRPSRSRDSLVAPVPAHFFPPPSGYPTFPPLKMSRPKISDNNNKKRRNCWQEFKTVLGVTLFCVSVIVKGVAYSNSHWSNSDRVDIYKALEKFPLMTHFIEQGEQLNDCEDQRCKTFFQNYNAARRQNMNKGQPPPPLSGTYSRGINSRCETIEASASGLDYSGSENNPKYEKCAVDKERDVNEFKTCRVLLIISMVIDGLAIMAWIITFIKDASKMPVRAALSIAALFGLVSTLMTLLVLGLFVQAVKIFDDSNITLGWPFYVVIVTALLAIVTTILAGSTLYENQQKNSENPGKKLTGNSMRVSSGFEQFLRQQYLLYHTQRSRAIAPPPSNNNGTKEPAYVETHQEQMPPAKDAKKAASMTSLDSKNTNASPCPSRKNDHDDGDGSLRRGDGGRAPFQAL